MPLLVICLRVAAVVFFGVAALHLTLGLGADVLLGAHLPADVINDPVLDSQNRFYGTSFAIYGVLSLICAADLRKYATILRCVLWCFFAGGLARLVSISLHGLPSTLVLALLVVELVLPPLLLSWLQRVERMS